MRACTRQPVGAVKINPIFADGLTTLIVSGMPLSVVDGFAITAVGVSLSSNAKGRCLFFNGVATNYIGLRPNSLLLSGTGKTTQLAVIGSQGIGGYDYVLSRTGTPSGSLVWQISQYTNQNIVIPGFTSVGYGNAAIVGNVGVVAFSYDISGGAVEFSLNGASDGSLTNSETIYSLGEDRLGYYDGSQRGFAGGINLFAAWNNRVLPSAYLHALTDNPWSLFTEPRWLYTGMGSGSWTPLEVQG